MLDRRKIAVCVLPLLAASASTQLRDGRFLFEQETFNGNGRTCLGCHSRETGTLSPLEAQRRIAINRLDPLFRHDGSDDGHGRGVQRMLTEATILVEIPLPPNVSLADDPSARSVILRRGIPSTINTPALDPVLMWDGREPPPAESGEKCDSRPCASYRQTVCCRPGCDREVPTQRPVL